MLNKPISKAKSHKNIKLNNRALPYTNSSLLLKDRLLYLLLHQLQFKPRLTFCAQSYADMLGSQDASYISYLLRSLRDDHRFIISLPMRRPKSQFYFPLEIQLSPFMKELQQHQPYGANILERSDRILDLLPSVSRERLTPEITKALQINLRQQAKLEAYPLPVLQKAWKCMKRYLRYGKKFYYSAFTYFNAMLDRIALVTRDTVKRIHEPVASFALYYQKMRELTYELMKPQPKAICLKTEYDIEINEEGLYWSDYEKRK